MTGEMMVSILRLMLLAVAGMLVATAANAQLPSGERELGKTVIEPGYDDRTGELIYIMTPEGPPFPSKNNGNAVSPLFLVMYPHSAGASVGTMNCAHEGGDNCPDHGPVFATLAQNVVPDVYGEGVWGHDHIMDGPGGSEFNVTWQIVVVLFTNAEAANRHITTEDQLDAALDAGDAITIETPITFHCNLVSASVYNRATPIPAVSP
jgi:hypothetical protein